MLTVLPLAAYIVLFLAFVWHGSDRRSAVLHASIGLGVVTVAITEILSLSGRLTWMTLTGAWLAIDALAVVYAVCGTRQAGPPSAPPSTTALGRAVDVALLAGVGLISGMVGIVALLSPPNTWDAMQYHVPRVVHWIRNGSVAFYPTHELKQLHMPPGAEFLVLQLHALWGGDRLDNLVQWFAFLGSVVGVTVLARSLGAGPRGQVLAAVACATIPQGILAASGAKNDYVLSLWMVALAHYALEFRRDPCVPYAAGLGAALGLAWLTKGTGYALAAPMLFTLWLFWPRRVQAALLGRLPLVFLLAISLNAGHFARNWHLYRSPLGPGFEGPSGSLKYTNDAHSAAVVLSNLLRNTALHVRSERRAKNAVIERWLRQSIRKLGGDADDPRTNFFDRAPFRLPEVQVHESFAENSAHLLLVALTLLTLCFTGLRSNRQPAAVYALALTVSYVAFCAILKWQPTNARLQLPLFVLWSAAIGAVIGTAWPAVLGRGLATLLLALSVPFVLGNEVRTLSPDRAFSVLTASRTHLYFGDRRREEDAYVKAARAALEGGCRRIGLDLSSEVGEQYEYPLLALLDAEDDRMDVREVGVTNASAVYARANSAFTPCAVICVLCERDAKKLATYGSGDQAAAVFDHIAVFKGQH